MRHSWVHPKTHIHVCRRCGTGQRNLFDEDAEQWVTLYYPSTGGTQVGSPVPPCVVGERTGAALEKYALEIAEDAARKAGEGAANAARKARRPGCGGVRI